MSKCINIFLGERIYIFHIRRSVGRLKKGRLDPSLVAIQWKVFAKCLWENKTNQTIIDNQVKGYVHQPRRLGVQLLFALFVVRLLYYICALRNFSNLCEV